VEKERVCETGGNSDEWSKPSYPIRLTEEEKKQLQKQVKAHKTGQDLVVRAKLLLAANEHPEWSNPQIAEAVVPTA